MSSAAAPADAAYQGRPGAYSEAAARRFCGPAASCLPCDTLRDVFRAVATGQARRAVVPVENSLAGAVPGALDLFLDSNFVAHGEVVEPIDHVLAALPGATLAGVRDVLSHPVALAQCESFFRRHPAMAAVPVFDTAGAVELLVREGDPSRAAIASRAAVARHQAIVLAEGIQDHAENYTRFLCLGPAPAAAPASGPCRLLLAARTAHRPGALAAMLHTIASFGVNLTRIDSRPVKGQAFEYEFLLESLVESAAEAGPLVDALAGAGAVRVLGCVTSSTRRLAAGPAQSESRPSRAR